MPDRWLLKTDPARFTFDDLLEARRTTWRGVRQRLSLSHLRRMRRGDEVLVYHAGSQRRIVGLARVVKGARPDPDDADLSVVDIAPLAPLARPLPLAELREEPALEGWALLRIPRLHVMPVPAAAWRKVLALSRRA